MLDYSFIRRTACDFSGCLGCLGKLETAEN
jgi:hypothetical protein